MDSLNRHSLSLDDISGMIAGERCEPKKPTAFMFPVQAGPRRIATDSELLRSL